MNDIVKDAKQLLEGATLGPWEWEERKYRGNSDCHHDWLGSEHGTALVTFDSEEYSSWVESTDSDKALIASAPELAQALAEETWEYSFQILRRDEWEHASDRISGVDEWFPSKYVADFIMDAAQKSGYVCRLVRRRVSPPEVVSE